LLCLRTERGENVDRTVRIQYNSGVGSNFH
jgi:hypothetical protein